MKTIFTLSFFILASHLFAQSFTNGSVFNFAVNDTIVTEYIKYPTGWGGPTSPPVTTYRIFKQKQYSANLDTVFYQTDDYVVANPGCVGCSPTVTFTVKNFFITGLNSSAKNYTLLTCNGQIDSSFVNECGRNEHSIDAGGPFGSCVEPNLEHYRIIEGVGIFHLFRSGTSSGFGDETKLKAYHKVSQPACGGSIGAIPTGISEWKQDDLGLKIYPNPSNGNYTLDIKTEGKLFIRNLLGEEIYNSSVQRGTNLLDLTKSVPGVYILVCKSENKTVVARIIKE